MNDATVQLALCKGCGRPYEKLFQDDPHEPKELLSNKQDMTAWTDGCVNMMKIVSEFHVPARDRFRALERVRDMAEHLLAKIQFSREGD